MADGTDDTRVLTGITEGIAEIIQEVTAGNVTETVSQEASLRDDLDIDSLAIVEIAVRVEEAFGVKIPNSTLDGFATVGDMVRHVARRMPSSA